MTKLKMMSILGAMASVMALPVCADVVMPSIYGDNMVLAQGKELKFHGKADPGEKVKISFNGKTAETVAGKDGTWRITLPAMKVDHQPKMLTVEGNNKLNFRNVLLGDVYLASGQSNMEWNVARSNGGKELCAGADIFGLRVRRGQNSPAQYAGGNTVERAWRAKRDNRRQMVAWQCVFIRISRPERPDKGGVLDYPGGGQGTP